MREKRARFDAHGRDFVRSIVEERKPWIDAVTAANWTAAGVCAHASAMHDGKEVTVPDFA